MMLESLKSLQPPTKGEDSEKPLDAQKEGIYFYFEASDMSKLCPEVMVILLSAILRWSGAS